MKVNKDLLLDERNIKFAIVEVTYDKNKFNINKFREEVNKSIISLRKKYSNYDRKEIFGENPYSTFFKKFKKTFPVMLQFESIIIKCMNFPNRNPITEVPYIVELETLSLLGTHDIDKVVGNLNMYSSDSKESFIGMRGEEVHTYNNDICGKDDEGIILSMIAGADNRTCVKDDSNHVFYPIFGTPSMSEEEIKNVIDRLTFYIKLLQEDAKINIIIK